MRQYVSLLALLLFACKSAPDDTAELDDTSAEQDDTDAPMSGGSLRVELSWAGGQDLDLQLGAEGDVPFGPQTASWCNTPDWGVPGDAIDNATITDATTAPGPELLRIQKPADADYEVYVTLFANSVCVPREGGSNPADPTDVGANVCGDNAVTVRVFVRDQLLAERTANVDEEGEVWHVGTVNAHRATFAAVDDHLLATQRSCDVDPGPLPDPDPGAPDHSTARLRFELTWDADADLDLHLATNDDDLFGPSDFSFCNREPFGTLAAGTAPLLTDGMQAPGPEILSIASPLDNAYTVRAMMYRGSNCAPVASPPPDADPADAEIGSGPCDPVNAELKIFADQALLASRTVVFDESKESWEAGVLTWGATPTFTPIGLHFLPERTTCSVP